MAIDFTFIHRLALFKALIYQLMVIRYLLIYVSALCMAKLYDNDMTLFILHTANLHCRLVIELVVFKPSTQMIIYDVINLLMN